MPTKTKLKVKQQPRVITAPVRERRVRGGRMQFAYMKAPGAAYVFEVGDTVEVFCDHEKNSERVRGWVKGIVVQVDNKMVAVQFRSNVFLTDGWMVPDRILWYPLNSDQIRPAGTQKKLGKKELPEY
ncbi:MAG: hypothetical protein HYR70_12380 [Chloroflexi bacterium]|nr:hypothetical protein [Chloroflexota bacterium]MBI1854545.1 hypothetical protein [Chloroflexota bacterium]MBI3339428.1 hypothetical protein [Chloroflexota bacterium]